MRKLSRQKLAAAIGITFQQLQKYENGTNRASTGRLYAFSTLLDVPVGEWFEGLLAGRMQGDTCTRTNTLTDVGAKPRIDG